MSRVLVVDDKELMRDSVATTLTRRGHTVSVAPSGAAAVDKLQNRPADVVVTDLQMPDMDGLDLLQQIVRIDDQLPVILMTAYGTIETAVTAMKHGAFDYITKPFSGEELQMAVERAIKHRKLLHQNEILQAKSRERMSAHEGAEHQLIGESSTMRAVRDRLALIADSHGTVLIDGESGSGKEVAAQWIHASSPRSKEPFLAINCAALSSSLLESELFGHEKGAFTGADKLRKGRFELADGGTLLLDEISEISSAIQAKLLRVLQERSFERVGSSTSRSVDVRVIATSNRNLPAEVARGNFRDDLYYRLNVLPVTMPSLRERVDDIQLLAAHFLAQVARREGRSQKSFEDRAIGVMRQYTWPGNVRELQNICERAAVLSNESHIRADLIEPWLTRPPARASATVEVKMDDDLDCPAIVCDGRITLEDLERSTIVATLQHMNGHRQRSAKALGIGVRTLGLKLKKWKEQQLVEPSL